MATKAQHARRYLLLPPMLRALREEAGLTQRQLGAMLRKPQSWVHSCEVGNRRVDVAEFYDWCRGCAIDPTDAFKRFAGRAR